MEERKLLGEKGAVGSQKKCQRDMKGKTGEDRYGTEDERWETEVKKRI